ncbi:MAG TPA: hypothetical protein VGB75_18715 [Jatrophihabitans sp.]|jgi:hypothetical protein|uniref:hypothetical protein n=1 Tax=Jatrophihabitans sp. TaxID=1932789 RepID=UPI002F04999C
MNEPDPTRTPATVIAAVAAGTAVVPFLIVYSFLFIVRGGFVEVDQPDITSSRSGELIAGLVAFAFLIFVLWGMGRLINGWDRWVFLAGQLLTAGVALSLLLDSASGEPQVPAVVLIAAVLALTLACLPPSWRWVATEGGHRVAVAGTPAHPAAPEGPQALGGPALGGPALGGPALGGPTLGGPALGGPVSGQPSG